MTTDVTRRSDRSRLLLPIAATLGAIALFSVMDALMKRAALVGGVYPALFARSLAGALVLGPIWWLGGGRWPAPAVLRLHVLRGVLAAGMASSFFYGILYVPLAEGMAISFIAPLLALGLAAAVLGEVIRRAAIVAALIALVGVGVIAWGRLGQAGPSPAAAHGIIAILCSAVLYAWNLIVQRQQAQLASPLEVALSQNAVIALVLALMAPVAALVLSDGHYPLTAASLLWPVSAVLPDILFAAALASASLMLLAWAYARAEAQWLVPLEYTAFVWSAMMGWWWFGEVVTGWTLAGLGLILAGVWLGTRRADTAKMPLHTPPG